MARIPYVEEKDHPELAADITKIKGARGGLINIYKLLLHSPTVCMTWFEHIGAIRWKTKLSPRLRELAIVRIAQAARRLEGGAAANELVVRELPERLARQQSRLHDFRHALEALRLGQGLEQCRIDTFESVATPLASVVAVPTDEPLTVKLMTCPLTGALQTNSDAVSVAVPL